MSAAAPAPLEARIQADLLQALQNNLLGIGLGNAAVAMALAAALRGHAAPWPLGVWLALQCGHSALSVGAWLKVRGRPVRPRGVAQRARAGVWASAASGWLWAAALPLFWPADRLDLQLLMLTLLMGLASGAVHSLSVHPKAFRAYFVPTVGASVAMCLWQGGLLQALIAVAALAYGVTGARFARSIHEVQRRSLVQREELALLAADLAVQKERAEAASGAKSRFLAAASHDIRQPVHALQFFLGAFDDRALTGRNAELIQPLRESARVLREMLDGVLDLSQAEAGAVQARIEAVAAQALLDRIEREFATLADARGLLLRTVPSALWLWADPALTERILRNLVSNALNYTRQGGVLVAVRRRAGQGVLEVWDTGPGIAPQDQARLFDEFIRGDGAARADRSGLGLGLSIARHFAQAQGSALRLASRLGRGTVFRLALPLAPAPAATVRARPADRPAWHGLRVLLIEDDAAVRAATAGLLQDWGCQVEAVATPEAWCGSQPQLVITDNRLGGHLHADGVARRLPGVPLVVVTGDLQADNLDSLRAQGVPILTKPVAPAELEAALSAHPACGGWS